MSGEPVWAEANKLMIELGFDHNRIRRAQIWAARDRECPKCTAPPNKPCVNLNGFKIWGYNLAMVKINKHPHPDRIDWDKLVLTLHDWKW